MSTTMKLSKHEIQLIRLIRDNGSLHISPISGKYYFPHDMSIAVEAKTVRKLARNGLLVPAHALAISVKGIEVL